MRTSRGAPSLVAVDARAPAVQNRAVTDPDDAAPNRARDPEARLAALELEVERAHHVLDEVGVPRSFRPPGARDPVDYALHARLELLFEEEDD